MIIKFEEQVSNLHHKNEILTMRLKGSESQYDNL